MACVAPTIRFGNKMTGNAASSGSRGIPQLFGVRLSLSAAFGRLTCHAARQFVFLLYNGIRPNYSAQTLLGVFSPPLRICTMRPLIVPACITLFAGFAGAASYDVRYGSFEAPDDFVFKHTGTLDSFRGTLTRKSDGFTISFDIGLMAGAHMYPSKQDEALFFARIRSTATLPGRASSAATANGQLRQPFTSMASVLDGGARRPAPYASFPRKNVSGRHKN